MSVDPVVSGLITQRDAALRRLAELEAENRFLAAHQADIRDWLAAALQQWTEARGTPTEAKLVDDLHAQATARLADARAATQRVRR